MLLLQQVVEQVVRAFTPTLLALLFSVAVAVAVLLVIPERGVLAAQVVEVVVVALPHQVQAYLEPH